VGKCGKLPAFAGADFMYKIEKDVPIPDDPFLDLKRKYPFAELEIGDSFVVAARDMRRTTRAADQYRRRHQGWNYRVKRLDDGTVRLWRVA
jgi:hypothetical protein